MRGAPEGFLEEKRQQEGEKARAGRGQSAPGHLLICQVNMEKGALVESGDREAGLREQVSGVKETYLFHPILTFPKCQDRT